MQGFEQTDRPPTDAEGLAGHLVPAGSVFAFLAAHRAEVFRDADYADLFAPPGVGRPLIPAIRMAAIMTLQALHDYSDRETAEAVRFDVRWKVAIGAAVDDAGLRPVHAGVLAEADRRSKRPHRVNDAVKKVVQETGILKGRRRRAVDSTILADAVATQDTVTQLISAIRRVAREVPGAAERIAAVCTGHDYSVPGKPKIDWDDPAAKDALVSALVNDANAVVAAFKDADWASRRPPRLRCWRWSPDRTWSRPRAATGPTGGGGSHSGSPRIAWSRPWTPMPGIPASPPRPDGTGTGRTWPPCPETGIITDEKLTRAAGTENSDPAVAEEFLAAEAGQQDHGPHAAGRGGGDDAGEDCGGQPLAWYGDSAYGTGDLRGAISDAGHTAVIKPRPLRAPVEGGLTVDDFTVDEQAGTVTCPAGHTVALSRTRVATFGVACRDCPLRARCTTSKTGRKLVLHRRDDLLRAARADWAAGTGLRKDYQAHRPNVERAVAQVATWRGRRLKLRYRGVARNHAWLKRRTAALNLRNLIGKGLAWHGAWALAS